MTGRWTVGLALLCAGCGLTLDLQPGTDASGGGMDARVVRVDSGPGEADAGLDAARSDAGPPDSGPPRECDADSDCLPAGPCDGGESCVEGTCVRNDVTIDCGDPFECTLERCDPAAGGCVSTPDDTLCPVLPASDCRVARCLAGEGCVLEPSDARCDDGVPCTEDTCGDDGACIASPRDEQCVATVGGGSVCDPSSGTPSGCTPVMCTSDADCPVPATGCTVESRCDSGTGLCEAAYAPDGTACDDGRGCTASAACDMGVCVRQTRVACADRNPCTRDLCVDELDGSMTCSNPPNTAADGRGCESGVACTTGMCRDGVCEVGPSTCADDLATCTSAVCHSSGDLSRCDRTAYCANRNLVCRADGTCGGCRPGFSDCDGDGTCECDSAADCACPVDAGPADAGTVPNDDAGRDAGVDSGAIVLRDSGTRPRDAGACLSADREGLCPDNLADCGDGCCSCDLRSHVCSGGACN